MDNLEKILGYFEIHSVEGIRACFQQGVDPNTMYQGRPLVDSLVNMYLRSPRFKDCVQAFVDYGLQYKDTTLLAVLLDDARSLAQQLHDNPLLLTKKYSLDCTFTPLKEASLLHICAEYNHTACAEILLQFGAAVNEKAGVDEHGFGAQTPIFHTVNQHNNACIAMLRLLLEAKADLSITVTGIIWGKGYPWETFIPSVNPISYAMMGLLRQFQRTEEQIYEVIALLMKARYGIDYTPGNVPNKYLST